MVNDVDLTYQCSLAIAPPSQIQVDSALPFRRDLSSALTLLSHFSLFHTLAKWIDRCTLPNYDAFLSWKQVSQILKHICLLTRMSHEENTVNCDSEISGQACRRNGDGGKDQTWAPQKWSTHCITWHFKNPFHERVSVIDGNWRGEDWQHRDKLRKSC